MAADVAFGYFSRPELVQQWLAPQAVIDARVGGQYELFWDPADPDNDSTVGCRVTAVLDGQLLAFQWRTGDTWEEARVWQERAWSVAFGELAHEVEGPDLCDVAAKGWSRSLKVSALLVHRASAVSLREVDE